MKKLFFVAIAAVGLCFASCKDKATTDQPAAAQDSVEAVVEDPAADLQKALEANDSSAFQKIITTVTEKFDALKSLDGDALAKAKEYIAKAQTFLKENAEKITAFVGGNSVISGLLDKVNAIPAEAIAPVAAAEGAAADAVEGAKDAAESAVEGAASTAAEKVEGAVDAAKDAAGKAVDATKEAASKAAEKVGEAADKAVDGAKKALGL